MGRGYEERDKRREAAGLAILMDFPLRLTEILDDNSSRENEGRRKRKRYHHCYRSTAGIFPLVFRIVFLFFIRNFFTEKNTPIHIISLFHHSILPA